MKIFLYKFFFSKLILDQKICMKISGLIKTPPQKKSTKSACKVQGLQDFLQGLQGARLEKTQGVYKVQGLQGYKVTRV